MQAYQNYKSLTSEGLNFSIPEHWHVKKARFLFSFEKGLTITKDDLQDEGVPCVNYGEIHSKYGFEVDPNVHPLKFVSADYLKNNSSSLLRRGDFVFADTSEDTDGSGNFTYLNSDATTFAGYHTVIARPNGQADTRYLAYMIDSIAFRSQVQRAVKGVKVFSISQGLLKDVRVILPPKEEQNAISKFLDAKCAGIDEAVRIKKEQIALLQERRQILIQQAVTRGLNTDAPMKDSGIDWIGEIPTHWEAMSLKHLFAERNLRTTSGQETLLSLRMFIGLVPHEEVSDKPIPPEALIDYKIVKPGQMVMNRMRASIGLFGVANQLGLVSPDYAVFDINQAVHPEYFLNLFKSELLGTRFRLSSRGMGTGSSGFMRLYTDDFGSIKVPLPPISEQQDIAEYIAGTYAQSQNAISIKQKQITTLKEYKSSLINAAVTGKIKVI